MTTNFDKIKSMNVNELAEWLSDRASCCFCIFEFEQECNSAIGCVEGIERWLMEEAQ